MVDLKKDSAQISLELRGAKYSGMVTDADLLCFYGLFFLEDGEREQLERRGAGQLLEFVQERQRQMLEEIRSSAIAELMSSKPNLGREQAAAEAEQEVVRRFDRQIAETLFWRTNNNHSIRTEVAVRILEIFPAIDRSLVSYDFKQGTARIRLTSTETMTLVMSILGGLMNMTYEAPPEKAKVEEVKADPAPAPGSAIIVEPAQEENPYGLPEDVLKHLSPEAKAKLGIS